MTVVVDAPTPAARTASRSIIKRDGSLAPFDPTRIRSAVERANAEVAQPSARIGQAGLAELVSDVTATALSRSQVSVEEVQDLVEAAMFTRGLQALYTTFHDYRLRHAAERAGSGDLEARVMGVVRGTNEVAAKENSNKDATVISTQRDLVAGEVSRSIAMKHLPRVVVEAHRRGLIHYHDADYDIHLGMVNCCLVNLEDMLRNGTVLGDTLIETPRSFATACTVTCQISGAVAANQYGGQTISLAHLAPYVDVSRRKIRARLAADLAAAGVEADDEAIARMAEAELVREVESGCQTLQYQWISLSTTNGQAPFITAFMYLGEAEEGQERDDLALIIATMLRQRMHGVKDAAGHLVPPAFPKLIYVIDEDNEYPGSPYYHLTELSAECNAQAMVPDFVSAKVMRELKGGVWPMMGCRSHLTPDRFTPKGQEKRYYGRFNQGVVTLNLPMVTLDAGGEVERFWDLLDEDLELVHTALRHRHEQLLGTTSDVAPILWQHGAYARLEPGEVIDPLLYGGYSTLSLGYAGLAEAVRALTGVSHTEDDGREVGLRIMQRLNDKCNEWKKAEDIDYSVYGTPLESTTQKFASALQREHGVIEHVSDKPYVTNSYHVHVTEPIDAFSKLTKEAEFQRLSPGGAISYVEVPSMRDNLDALMDVIHCISDTIMYAEVNTKLDVCERCEYTGEIECVLMDGRYGWRCPRCGNTDEATMRVLRRTCGYLGAHWWNQGRTAEIHDRVLHL